MTDKIIEEALERHALSQESEAEGRRDMLDDIRFAALEQWPDGLKRMREQDINGARPCLVLDKIGQYRRQIINDTRQNLPAIRVRPVDDKSDKDTADVINGIIRHIEDVSSADIAYLTALDWAATPGLGYFRILTEYLSDDAWDQEIRIARIHNPFAVYFDPHSTAPDGSDAEWCFITDLVPHETFKKQHPKAELSGDFGPASEGDRDMAWFSEDTVRVAEYFAIERVQDEVVLLADHSSLYGSRIEALLAEGAEVLPVLRSRPVDRRICRWRKITGCEVLEESEFPSSYIPVIPVIGTEFWIDGKRKLSGMVRAAKDAQRAYNYWAPLSLDTPLPTPSGWTTMGDVSKGDVLFDDKGLPCNVLGTSPVYSGRECFRVVFDDGTSIVADAEHLWTVEERVLGDGEFNFVWATKTLTTAKLRSKDHFIYVTRPLDLAPAQLPVDPYYLGVWLGDGTSRVSSITSGAADVDEMRQILEECGLKVGAKRKTNTACIFTVHGVAGRLAELGLISHKLGRRGERVSHKAIAKHIPKVYLRASFQQRLALLQGLMDTDGSISKATGQCSFTTTVPELRDGFAELLRSLGLKAVVIERPGAMRTFPSGRTHKCAVQWQFSFSPRRGMEIFRLNRKASVKKQHYHDRRTGRFGIKSIERVDSVPVKCVSVDSESHLFLAGISMVPTHNSVATEIVALAPRAPFVGAAGQFEGYEHKWAEANSENHAYLEYNPISLGGTLAPPPQRQQFAGVPMGIIQQLELARGDVEEALGMYKASVGAPSNEKSGIAIRERKNEGDIGNLHFRDNLSRSMRHAGRILMEMIPRIYDTARIARIIGEDGSVDTVALDPRLPAATQQTEKGRPNLHNITIGRYDVSVQVGPGYATRRQDAAQGMIEMVQANPQLMQIAGDLLVQNMDWPGAEQLAERLKKSLPPQLMDQEEDGGQQIPPEVAAKITAMQQQYEQQLAQAQEALAGMQEQLGEAESKAADTEGKEAEVAVKRFEAETKRLELEIKRREAGARIEHTEAQTAQIQGPNEILAGLIAASQGMAATIAELSQAAAGMNAPKRIDLVRDNQGRAAGAVVVPG